MPDTTASVRAALLGIVILWQMVVASPVKRVTDKDLAKEAVQQELDDWMVLVAPLGISRETFVWLVQDISAAVADTERVARIPLKPIFRFTGTGQGWALFAAPALEPQHIQIWGQRGDDEVLLYRRWVPEAQLLHDELRWRRLRGIWDGVRDHPTRQWKLLTSWAGAKVLADDPTLDEVEIRLVKVATHPPDGRPTGIEEIRHTRRLRREDP